MRKETIKDILIALSIIFCLMFFVVIIKYNINKQQKQCNELGGVYIDGQCIKAELIKLD